ncbi:hypothetical protein [Hyphomicrobium sp. 99]|uniref:hypothetical protein n=1 Tax=Hyphomicrobium sp. 99 TaxID=1163419 RepID=UPI0005F7A5EA|nr:hypothetical protein [Hyphomicrobium sp. 99]
MTKTASDKPMRRPTGATPYAAIWFTLGGAGLGYLCVAFFAPHLLPDFSGGRLSERASETQVLQVSADVEYLKSSLTKLQADVESVKSDVSAQATQTLQLGSQLAALDEKVHAAPTQTSALVQSSPPPTPDVPDFASGATQAHVEDAPAAPPPTKVINASPQPAPQVGAPIVTGSVTKSTSADAISFGPAVVKPAPKPIGIQIATDASVDGLRITWSALAQTHPDQLGTLTAHYADLGTAANPNFGLIAGPIKSKADAKKICKELTAQSVSCKISDFKGAAL